MIVLYKLVAFDCSCPNSNISDVLYPTNIGDKLPISMAFLIDVSHRVGEVWLGQPELRTVLFRSYHFCLLLVRMLKSEFQDVAFVHMYSSCVKYRGHAWNSPRNTSQTKLHTNQLAKVQGWWELLWQLKNVVFLVCCGILLLLVQFYSTGLDNAISALSTFPAPNFHPQICLQVNWQVLDPALICYFSHHLDN